MKPMFTKAEYLPDVIFECKFCSRTFNDKKKYRKHINYEVNKDFYLKKAKEWAKNNPEKRRKAVNNYNHKFQVKLNKRLWHENKFFSGNATLIGRKCILCSKDNDLIIHHKDGCNGINGKPINNQPNNLFILCRSCHPKVHNRHWIKEVGLENVPSVFY